jgi:hypothetical protein
VSTTSVGAFVVVLGFLAGRMNGGADPALSGEKTTSKTAPASQSTVRRSTTTTTTPAQTYSHSDRGYAGVAQDPSPPTTHSS